VYVLVQKLRYALKNVVSGLFTKVEEREEEEREMGCQLLQPINTPRNVMICDKKGVMHG